jgi:hypothetical protein
MCYTRRTMKHVFGILPIILSLLAWPLFGYAQLSGGNYEIYGDTFSFVNTGSATGGIYTLYDSGGDYFATSTTGGDYTVRGGFRAVEKGILRVDTSTSSIDLGLLTTGSVTTGSIDVTVWTDNFTGYTLYIREDTDPTSGADTLDDVADGVVTAGAEEYGIAHSGADSLTGGLDVALTSTSTAIAQSMGTVTEQQNTIEYKVAISSSTPSGTYLHTVYHSIFVNP